jgi:hypothetical protein
MQRFYFAKLCLKQEQQTLCFGFAIKTFKSARSVKPVFYQLAIGQDDFKDLNFSKERRKILIIAKT